MNKQLIKLISEMKEIDQDLRLNAKPGRNLTNYMIYVVDFIHGQRIKDIIKKHGYPNKKMVGKKTMIDFWLLIQHQDHNIDLQKSCLKNCDFDNKYKAFLTDRILLNSGKKQKFGTQFNGDITDEKNVDKRRKKMGLEPLSEYLAKAKKRFI